MQYCVVSNYGDESIALLQWLSEQALRHVHVLYVDTGWAAAEWAERVAIAEQWATTKGFHVEHLIPALQF